MEKSGLGTRDKISYHISFSPEIARYIKISLDTAQNREWTISELSVYTTGSSERQPTFGTKLSQIEWLASASDNEFGGSASNAIDGILGTRWSTGSKQSENQWFRVDMGGIKVFSGIEMNMAESPNDFPIEFTVYTSEGKDLKEIVRGKGFGPVLRVKFPKVSARYILVKQTGESTNSFWSIGEFNVYK